MQQNFHPQNMTLNRDRSTLLRHMAANQGGNTISSQLAETVPLSLSAVEATFNLHLHPASRQQQQQQQQENRTMLRSYSNNLVDTDSWDKQCKVEKYAQVRDGPSRINCDSFDFNNPNRNHLSQNCRQVINDKLLSQTTHHPHSRDSGIFHDYVAHTDG